MKLTDKERHAMQVREKLRESVSKGEDSHDTLKSRRIRVASLDIIFP